MLEALKELFNNPAFKSQVKYFTKKYNANEKILQQGKMHADIYLIKTGSVKVMISDYTKTTAKKKKSLHLHPSIDELAAGEIFGEFGLFDDEQEPASADVIAVTDSELIEIDIQSFRAFLNANPEIGYQILQDILRSLVKRLRHADKTIINLYRWGVKVHEIDKFLE